MAVENGEGRDPYQNKVLDLVEAGFGYSFPDGMAGHPLYAARKYAVETITNIIESGALTGEEIAEITSNWEAHTLAMQNRLGSNEVTFFRLGKEQTERRPWTVSDVLIFTVVGAKAVMVEDNIATVMGEATAHFATVAPEQWSGIGEASKSPDTDEEWEAHKGKLNLLRMISKFSSYRSAKEKLPKEVSDCLNKLGLTPAFHTSVLNFARDFAPVAASVELYDLTITPTTNFAGACLTRKDTGLQLTEL